MPTYEATRQTEGLFRALERDEEQYMKAVRAVQDGKMAPFESTLLAEQLTAAHKAWVESWTETS